MSALASPCFDASKDDDFDWVKLTKMPLDMKVAYSKMQIQKHYIKNKGKIYVSFSGGKDSTVLLHLVRSIYPEVPGMFLDTGLEYPDIRKFVKTFDNIEWVKPCMTFKEVIKTYGYPVVSKQVASCIDLAQRGFPSGRRWLMKEDSWFGRPQWEFLIDAPFRVSGRCCSILKKNPAKLYERKTGRKAVIGTRIEESIRRKSAFITEQAKGGNKRGSITPLSIWSSKDVDEYIRRNGIEICNLYSRGFNRTGCAFCMFGITQTPQKFQILKIVYPKLWEYCMKPLDDGGLGMKQVLDYIHVPTGCEQNTLYDYEEGDE